jgi:hypothetical protein
MKRVEGLERADECVGWKYLDLMRPPVAAPIVSAKRTALAQQTVVGSSNRLPSSHLEP